MRFRMSGAILRFAGYQRTVTVPATTLDEALKLLLDRHPGLAPVLYDNTGKVRRSHRLFLNGTQIENTGQSIALTDGDEVEVVTAIVGG